MTPQERKVIELALEALTYIYTETTADEDELIDQAITAIKEALAQPEQDPVTYSGNGTAGREADARPTGFFFQMPKPVAQPEQNNIYIYASSLATAIWQKHYMKESPKFALLDTTEGVLTQIDNMTCGLVREKPAQPEQESVAWSYWQSCLNDDGTQTAPWVHRLSKFKPTESIINKDVTPLYTSPPQRNWVGLTLTQVKLLWEGVQEEAVKSGDSLNWVFYTHINEALKEKNT